MELVRGTTLEETLQRHGTFGAREASLVGIDLCRALAAVHGAGLLHGDVKAHNVMREEGGRTVLMDFGAGKDLDQDVLPMHVPGSHDFAGTPPMSRRKSLPVRDARRLPIQPRRIAVPSRHEQVSG
jgi:serine/threonine protein kinase